MSAVAGPVFAASLLLAYAGATKLRRPRPTVEALRAAGLPAPITAGRIVGGFELAAAIWCLATGSRAACALVAVCYLAFAAFSARLMAAGGGASCGCFGQADTPASPVHVGVNLVLGLLAVAGALDPPGDLAGVLDDQPLGGAPLLMFVALGAWAAYLALTLLPALDRAVAGPGDRA
jgi:uncharacterized membrane protein YphA (DoxX/SURF4 family)